MLPRSRRGTWLLAGAVWLAACAGWWWALPVAPRTTIDGLAGRIRFSADQRTVFEFISDKFRAWDIDSGQLIIDWYATGRMGLSRPGFGLFVVVDEESDDRATVWDFESGRSDEITWWKRKAIWDAQRTSDGQYLVFTSTFEGKSETVWWDRRSGRIVARFPGRTALAVAPDGKWLSAGDSPTEISLHSPAAVEDLRQFPCEHKWAGVSFSADGQYVLITRSRTRVYDRETGGLCVETPARVDPLVFPDVRQAIGMEHIHGKVELSRWDLDSGESLGRQSLSILPGGTLHTRPFDDEIPHHGILVFRTQGRLPRPFMLWEQWLIRIGLGSWVNRGHYPYVFVDMRTGEEIVRSEPEFGTELHIASDGKHFGLRSASNRVEIWHMPPRRPLKWLAVGAAILAFPIALIARRRVRKLRAA